ncbi:MAG: YihY family inner membrane protein [Gammaproteobacteria bacterium]
MTAAQWLRRARDLVLDVAQEFRAQHCPVTAAGLAYTTILTLVPLLTVAFATFAAFPAFHKLQGQVELFVFENFVPALGETVHRYMSDFARKAAGLRAVGLAVLVVTVLMLMASIESAFDRIWAAPRRRRRLLRFLTYWAVLTLGPLLIGTGLAVTSYVVSLPLLTGVGQSFGLGVRLLALLPFATSCLAFLLLYAFLPNRAVRIRDAAVGALVAALLFEAAKRGFALFITRFPTNQAIYGAFATLPIFLVWIYVSWLVVLIGAVVARCLGRGYDFARPGGPYRSAFADAVRLVGALAHARAGGATPSTPALVAAIDGLGERRAEALLERLAQARWCVRTEDGGWALLRDPDAVSALDLYRIVPGPLPAGVAGGTDEPLVARLRAIAREQRERATKALDRPLRVLLDAVPADQLRQEK